ncbi:hypothetical protein AGMMS50212_00400 [Spirochaetia bacterium]|nr:hypothetical protein AGMMS50212_00400 [Spirochaetia bacterium]
MIFNGLIEGDDILPLVPHRGKMFMMSRITDYDTQKRYLCSEYDVDPSCLFYEPSLGAVPAWVSFEFMAQSVAALSGICARAEGKPISPGVILSISNFEMFVDTLTGSVQIRVEEDNRLDKIYTFDCTVSANGKKAVAAKLTVMDVEDLSVVLKK